MAIKEIREHATKMDDAPVSDRVAAKQDAANSI